MWVPESGILSAKNGSRWFDGTLGSVEHCSTVSRNARASKLTASSKPTRMHTLRTCSSPVRPQASQVSRGKKPKRIFLHCTMTKAVATSTRPWKSNPLYLRRSTVLTCVRPHFPKCFEAQGGKRMVRPPALTHYHITRPAFCNIFRVRLSRFFSSRSRAMDLFGLASRGLSCIFFSSIGPNLPRKKA